MGPIGIPEMLFILLIALLIFGPKRLPEFGRTIGKALGEFRRATTDLKRSIDVEVMTTEPTRTEPSTRAAAAAATAAASMPRDGKLDDDDPAPAAGEEPDDADEESDADAPDREGSDDEGSVH